MFAQTGCVPTTSFAVAKGQSGAVADLTPTKAPTPSGGAKNDALRYERSLLVRSDSHSASDAIRATSNCVLLQTHMSANLAPVVSTESAPVAVKGR